MCVYIYILKAIQWCVMCFAKINNEKNTLICLFIYLFIYLFISYRYFAVLYENSIKDSGTFIVI